MIVMTAMFLYTVSLVKKLVDKSDDKNSSELGKIDLSNTGKIKYNETSLSI